MKKSEVRSQKSEVRSQKSDKNILCSVFCVLSSVFCLLSSFFFFVSVSYAAGGHEAHHAAEFKPITELIRIINFLVVFGILYFLLSKPVKTFFTNRRESIVTTLNEAEGLKSSAGKKLSEWESKITDMKETILRVVEDAKREGEFIKNNIIRSADDASRKILEKAGKEIEYETKRAKERLRKETLELIMKMTEDNLKKGITKNDHTIIVKEYLESQLINRSL